MQVQSTVFSHTALLLLFLPAYLSSQDVRFEKLPEFDLTELGYGGVTDITQDPEGYMWFATLNGLYRYDGYQIITYQNDNSNPQSLALNHLNSVYADQDGLIWIGTVGRGVDCLNPKTGVFKNYRHHPNENESICNDTINTIRGDKNGFLWIGTMNGLSYLNTRTGKSTSYYFNKNDPNSISDKEVRVIYKDKAGTSWFGTRSGFSVGPDKENPGGLNRFNPETGNFTRYLRSPNDSKTLINNRITAIFEDSRGVFWVGTSGDGLHTMDRTTGAFERHTYDKTQPGKLSRPPIRNILSYTDDFITFINEDATKKIWIGTMSGGINRYDPVTQKMTFFNETTDPASGLTADCCYFTSFVSRDSVFWIAAWLGDLFKTDPYLNKIPFTPIDEYLNGIIKTNRDVFWSYGNGLTRKDVKTGLQKKYSHDPGNRNSLGYNDISHIEIGKNNTWWISTYGGGLDAFDPQTASFTHYNHDPQNKNSISDNVVSIVCEDGENLWIGTRRGLDLMNVTTGKFSHFIHSETDPNNDRNIKIHGIYVKNKETIWMATANARGMSVLNTTNGNIRKYYLEGKFISCIFRDHRDVVWAATDDGLFHYDAKKDVFSRFSDPHRFTKIGAVEQVQEDDKKNLWVFTRSAIHKISPNRDFINTYGSEYGVQKINAWLGIKFVTAPKGEIYFIDRNGYFSFKEEDVTYNPFPPQIIIRDIQIKGDSTLHSNAEQKFLINQQELVLAHHQNTFSIAFTPVHFANPQKNKIIFKLDGIDTDWRESGNERTAYYFNLPPGAYTFRIKACNATGVLSEKQLAITITPPWWQTWWAYLLYAATFIFSITAYVRYRSRKLLQENIILEAKVRQRTLESEQKSRDLEKSLEHLRSTQTQLIQSEKLASLGELTAGIAHEIQNPLNFVNNFSELSVDLAQEIKEEIDKVEIPEKDKAYLDELLTDLGQNQEKINLHGKRAASIVSGMLQHARSSTGKKESTDLNALADEYLRLAYHGLRAKDPNFNAKMETHFDPAIGKVDIIPQDMGRVLLNLVNNAFYAVRQREQQLPESLKLSGSSPNTAPELPGPPDFSGFKNLESLSAPYQPTVTISTQKTDNQIIIKIKDNGTGIPDDVKAKIFQPFFTTKPTGHGTGLGLSLAYDIITKGHGGTMEVESVAGEGTEFVVKLPDK